jgi:hypothetical protein
MAATFLESIARIAGLILRAPGIGVRELLKAGAAQIWSAGWLAVTQEP